jgi:hypothetical protein
MRSRHIKKKKNLADPGFTKIPCATEMGHPVNLKFAGAQEEVSPTFVKTFLP